MNVDLVPAEIDAAAGLAVVLGSVGEGAADVEPGAGKTIMAGLLVKELITHLDKLARNEDLQAKLGASECRCDFVICGEVRYTKRYRLGQLLSGSR